MSETLPSVPERRPIAIERVRPAVEDGRYPVKREVGDRVDVTADIFKEGHDVLAAAILYRARDEAEWREAPLRLVANDAWAGSFPLERTTRYLYTVQAWTDVFGSWCEEMARRVQGGQTDLASELAEGRALVAGAHARAKPQEAAALGHVLETLAAAETQRDRVGLLLDPTLRAAMARTQARRDLTRYDRELEILSERIPARYAAWYEMFPRSQGVVPERHGTFDDCIERLVDIERMGFDVVYLPPVHPIGLTYRKGRNNALEAGPNDPGSPWAIGGPAGGHTAIHPELGDFGDFERLLKAARDRGLEIALDFAVQCSPDHPWVTEHPDWFHRRPDGSIKYAENPPKKYQDIYPIDFGCEDWRALWNELLGVVLFWLDRGVRIFRVDNPHTKPIEFWQWLIREVQDRHPDAIFLSEAFTRPKVMYALAKAGFTQSYTYFTWRNFKEELTEYLRELTQTDVADYFRGNLFVNTPDILPEVLQRGGRPAFVMRATLAATLSSLWGVYSGFELCEAGAVPGTEEYLDSEKYEIRVRDWTRAGNIKDHIARLNRIRRENPALHTSRNLRFCEADSPHVLFYAKATPARDNAVLVVVNLDPFAAHEATLRLPLEELGIPDDETYELHELLTDRRRLGRGGTYRVRLEPEIAPAHIYRVRRWKRREADFQYFY